MRRGGGIVGAKGRGRGDTYEGVQGEEARLDPWPLSKDVHVSGGRAERVERRCIPVVCPRDGNEEDGSLEDMLKDDASPVVLYGVRRNRLGEGDAEDGVEARPDV